MTAAPYGDPDATRAMLEERYGTSRRPRRSLLVVVAVLAVVAVIAFAVVATNEPVRTREAAFRVIGPDTAEVTFAVVKAPETVADCTVVALGESFTEVGVATVRVGPNPGERVVAVSTSVRTTSPPQGARVDGCTVVDGP